MNEELSPSPLDDAPLDNLEDIFVLPPELEADPRVSRWHAEMVSRLRREAQGVPMKTAQYTLMERICYLYADMRYRELHDQNMSQRDKMQYMTAWQAMLDQFNRLLEKHNDKVVAELTVQVMNILQEALPIVTEKTERANLRRHLQEKFANLGM